MTQINPSEIIASRAVHNAMAASVQANGIDASKHLYESAARFNELYFDNGLTALLFEICAPASPAAYATHQPRTPEGVECVIRIAPSVMKDGPEFYLDVLLHEMIHVWQSETENREPGYQGHGPKFAAKANEIGARLGLGKVSVRGKADGEPDCAQWPLNVRPAGYYMGKRGQKAQTKARKPKGSPRASKQAVHTETPAVDLVTDAMRLVSQMSPEQLVDFGAKLQEAGY